MLISYHVEEALRYPDTGSLDCGGRDGRQESHPVTHHPLQSITSKDRCFPSRRKNPEDNGAFSWTQCVLFVSLLLRLCLQFRLLHSNTRRRCSAGLHWRDVGPMRGGRTYAVAGNASQPDTFYMGSVGGGVWKTENSGRTWFPIADDPKTGIPIGSIGAIAVAPSDPNIIYVGTGEPDIRSQHSYGIGLFKSTDAGKTWHSIGLAETRQIGQDRRRSRRSGPCLCGGARTRVQGQSRARRLSLHRRRSALDRRFWHRRRTRTMWAPSIWRSIRSIRGPSTRRCGPRAGRRGPFMHRQICLAEDFTNPPTAATHGINLAAACRLMIS